MKKNVSMGQMIVLNMYWIGLSFKWNSLHPLILPAVLLNYVPDSQKNTILGVLTFIGLIIATLVQPIAGAISDRWVTRWGRRRPLIIIGTIFDLVFLAILAWAGGLVWLFIGYIFLQFSSNVAHGAVQGLLPDKVPAGQLGTASGIKTFMDMLALIIASLVAGNLIDPVSRDPTLIVIVVIGLVILSTVVTVLGTKEDSTPEKMGARPTGISVLAEFKSTFHVDFKANTAYWWLISERFIFLLGIFGIQQFAQYYIGDVLQVANPVKATGDLMASLAIGLVIMALAGGWLTDRFGPKKVILVASLITGLGCILLLLVTSQASLVYVGSVIGIGMGLFLTANWALANQLAPGDEAGKYLGLTNIATAGAGALGRLWGPLLDGLNNSRPGDWLGYKSMFIFGAICAVASILLLVRIPTKKPVN